MIELLAGAAGNYITGAGIKVFSTIAGSLMENRHQYMMANSMASAEKLKAMNDGEDTLTDKMSRRTRSILAFIVIGSFSACVLWIVAVNPGLTFKVEVDKLPGLFSGLFCSTVPKGTIEISGGAILWKYLSMVEIVCGFYFTKVGKRA